MGFWVRGGQGWGGGAKLHMFFLDDTFFPLVYYI